MCLKHGILITTVKWSRRSMHLVSCISSGQLVPTCFLKHKLYEIHQSVPPYSPVSRWKVARYSPGIKIIFNSMTMSHLQLCEFIAVWCVECWTHSGPQVLRFRWVSILFLRFYFMFLNCWLKNLHFTFLAICSCNKMQLQHLVNTVWPLA